MVQFHTLLRSIISQRSSPQIFCSYFLFPFKNEKCNVPFQEPIHTKCSVYMYTEKVLLFNDYLMILIR